MFFVFLWLFNLFFYLLGEIHGFVSNLIQPNDDNKMADSIDLLAMAYIISVLQLLLGIDDSTERYKFIYVIAIRKDI